MSKRFESAVATASPSPEHLQSWPTLTRAAALIGVSLPVLSRAMNASGITKHPFGRRDKKIAPVNVLDLALQYGADVNLVAERLMEAAEESGAPRRFS